LLLLGCLPSCCTGEKSFLKVIEKIADYIANRQIRKEDGAFCRGDETIWVDDLYMGNQFLAKYYNLTGKRSYIDDAARQFLLYKKYLYMPEYGVMSHIYDLKYNTPTFVPWGRGNGWALFSLSEVLESLPESHNDYMQLLGFYKELCEGCLKLQGKNGLWHQVLTDPESYEETSCTAMFTYAFAKGVRFGWLDDTERYVGSIYKALEGLMTISIDCKGNVYGVCRGSNFSYSEQYYKKDLLWVTNDTHGIGIVLLAADETIKMIESRR
jgi:unsaturated rhamnogalacturonyl hydrolase